MTSEEPVAIDDKYGGAGIRLDSCSSRFFGKDVKARDEYLAKLLNGPRCRECSHPIYDEYMDEVKEQLHSRQLCFLCNFWTNILNEKEEHVFIDGKSFRVCEEPSGNRDGRMLGFGGSEFRIELFTTKEVIVTHNLWHQGDIPAWFRDRLPNTGRFL